MAIKLRSAGDAQILEIKLVNSFPHAKLANTRILGNFMSISQSMLFQFLKEV